MKAHDHSVHMAYTFRPISPHPEENLHTSNISEHKNKHQSFYSPYFSMVWFRVIMCLRLAKTEALSIDQHYQKPQLNRIPKACLQSYKPLNISISKFSF